jgi:hypothetical protein
MYVTYFSVVEVSSGSIVTVSWRAGVGFPVVSRNFVVPVKSTLALESTPCRPAHWVPMAVTQGVQRPERGGDHSYPSDSKIMNARSCTCTIHTPSWRCDYLSYGRTALLPHRTAPHSTGPSLTHWLCYFWYRNFLLLESKNPSQFLKTFHWTEGGAKR